MAVDLRALRHQWSVLVVGSIILVYAFGLKNPGLFVSSFLFAVVSLLVCVVTGAAYDLQNRNGSRGALG